MKKLAALALAALALTGCGSTAVVGQTASTPPSSSPSATPSVAATTWTTQEAGQQYVAMVAPLNAGITALLKEANRATPDLSAIAADCGALAKTDDTFVRQLISGRWPASVQGLVDGLETVVATDRGDYQQCQSDKGNQSAMFNDLRPLNGSDSPATKVELLRAQLGLPATK